VKVRLRLELKPEEISALFRRKELKFKSTMEVKN